jgi:hypothetical protein
MRSLNPVLVALIPLAIGTATGAMAETENLTCRPGASITAALAKLKPGDVLQVRGVCTENVAIPAHLSDITLQGVNGAIVQAVDTMQSVIRIRGRSITVSGLTVTGGVEGIQVTDGAFAWIAGNTIRLNSGAGIQVNTNSTARIWNNFIENNGSGVAVVNNSSALIGAARVDDPVASPNTIRNNSGNAVGIKGSSSGRIVGNTITGNLGGSVLVAGGAQAEIAGNNISANVGVGIQVAQNSTAYLAVGGGILSIPNSTDAAFPNTLYGVSCFGGGFITGHLGTLLGTSGASLIGDCSGGLVP